MFILRWLKRLLCHHNDVLQFEPNRIYPKCVNCGRETPGIAIGKETS